MKPAATTNTFGTRHPVAFLCAAFLVCAGMTASGAELGEELELVRLWKLHTAKPDAHAEFIAASAAFERDSPATPFLPVVRELAAWHHLKAGGREAARAIFEAMLTTGVDDPSAPAEGATAGAALQRGAADVARAWLTRLDREAVMAALKAYYLRRIEYPASLSALEELPEAERPPMTDRWGKPWTYRLVSIPRLPGVRGQKYELLSRMLDTLSSLEAGLALPYADTIGLNPVRLASSLPGRESVEFEQERPGGGTERAILSEGSRSRDELVAYIGTRLLIVCDHSFWKVLPRPAGGR